MKRRDFIRTSSIIVVSFAFGGAIPEIASAQAGSAARPVDPREVDSFLAVHPDGSVTVYTSKVDVGTGLRIALTQIVAEELGIPAERINVIEGDTALTPDQGGTGGALDHLPLRQQIPVPSERVEGEIRGGSIRVDMSETTGDLPRSPGDLANRCFGRRLDRVVKGLEPLPRDRGFESVGYYRPPHEPLACVGHPDERVAP